MRYYIHADQFYLPNGREKGGYLEIVDGKFGTYLPEGSQVPDAVDYTGFSVAPGYVDTHIHVSVKEDVMKSHELCDRIENDISEELGIQLTIHMDPLILDDPETNAILEQVKKIVADIDETLSVHDFRKVESYYTTNLIFDVEMPSDMERDGEKIVEEINQKLLELNPRYFTYITIDKHHFHKVFEMKKDRN